jgi:ubiquinone/menaquinone biosynthesis C-methylase UbiE
MTSEITYWNNDAANYDKRAKKSHKAYQAIIELIQNEISTDMDVLDMGTGTGEIPVNIYGNARSIDAVDFSPEMIQIAQEKADKNEIKNVRFFVRDSSRLSYKDNSFDVILIINLLHVVPNPEKVINEAKRLVKNEGKIIIASFLNDENLRSRLISYIMARKGHPVVTKFNTDSICEFVAKCSLKIDSTKNIKNIMPAIYLTASK